MTRVCNSDHCQRHWQLCPQWSETSQFWKYRWREAITFVWSGEEDKTAGIGFAISKKIATQGINPKPINKVDVCADPAYEWESSYSY